jgi:adenosine deaminase
MRHSTLIELAERYGVTLPERLVDDVPDDWRFLGWPRFQRLYDLARGVLRTAEDITRLMREIAEDEAAAGSCWLELQITPSGYAVRLGDLVTAMEVFCDGAAAAEAATGVGVRLIVAGNRVRPPWEAETQARLAVRFRDRGVIGFGLSNDERQGPPETFMKAFRIAHEGGLAAMPHAGELLGADSVARSIAAFQPVRIGHGVRAVEDPAVMAVLAERRIACEVCPTSNVALGVASGLDAVPLQKLEAAGVPVVLAADDPLLFGSGLVEQYAAVRDALGYARSDLARLAKASVEHSLMPAELSSAMMTDIDRWDIESGG